jgi:predicted  nucleic acid-binding Zn-ribbon protein
MALVDYFRGPAYKARVDELEGELAQLRQEFAQLENLARQCGAMEILDLKKLIAQGRDELVLVRGRVDKTEQERAAVAAQLAGLQAQVLVVEETLLLESFALYVPKFSFTSSLDYKLKLDEIRAKQKTLIKDGDAAIGSKDWTVNGKKAEGRKLVNDMLKLLIRSFNNECDYCVDNVKFDNVETGAKRIRQSFDACNKLGRVMSAELTPSFLRLKLDELYLAHEFQLKKQDEKEAAKKAREELREQQKLEQEIRVAREKIAKERKHFAAALRDLNERLAQAQSDQEREALQTKIAEVDAGRAALDGAEKVIDYREQNAKAGYVYVISNVGAFGEDVFKIGMTRRLEPLERIDELGDASVPFWFDVHALVFSDNAPALEAKLHDHFEGGRLNKVNGRKEFFRANIRDIEAVIRENYDAVVEVVYDAPAEQYRETLRMRPIATQRVHEQM